MIFGRISDAGFGRIAQTLESNYLRVFRGVGPRGAKDLKSSDDGMLGSGVYFYDHPYDARSYSSPGGGILYGKVPEEKAIVNGNVILVENPEDVIIEGLIPNEETFSVKQINEFLGEDFSR
jgi:hypothetical protein